jgi:hypothetical protein
MGKCVRRASASAAVCAATEIKHNEFQSAAIMPYGFAKNVTQITGLALTSELVQRPRGGASLGYNRRLLDAATPT